MGSKKKKKQQANVRNKVVAGKAEEKKELQSTQAGTQKQESEHPVAEAQKQKQESVHPVEEVQVQAVSETVSEPQSVSVWSEESAGSMPEPKSRVPFFGVLFGVLMTAAVVWLGVCFYQTSAELQSVQTFSGGLQTKLKAAEERLNNLSEAVKNVRLDVSETASGTESEQTEVADITKKPYPTPAPEWFTVCIDAGHGAHDPGAVLESEDGTKRQEKDDNLWLAKLVQKELEAYGIEVVMTREDDSFLELYDRTLTANSLDVDALISFHRNAYYLNGKMDDRVSGVEIWIHSSRPTSARQLANRMLDAILETGDMEDRGVRYGSMTNYEEDYAINRRAIMTSMIVEMGFISSEKDNEDFDTNGEAYAKVIAKEIYEWLTEQE